MPEHIEIIDVSNRSDNLPVLGTIARAELDVQITTAKAYPRSVSSALKEAIEMATLTKEIAQSCIYALPQKDNNGKDTFILGPSIRLAEIAGNCWGNLHTGSRIVENDGKTIRGEGVVWDLEKNNRVTIQASKSIVGKRGVFSAHMQNVTGAAAASIAYRNAMLKVIPKSIIHEIYKEAIKITKGVDKPLSQRVIEGVKYFTMLGISENNLLELLGKKSRDEIDEEDLLLLMGIKNAVIDGVITIDSILKTDQGDSKSKAKALNEKLGEMLK